MALETISVAVIGMGHSGNLSPTLTSSNASVVTRRGGRGGRTWRSVMAPWALTDRRCGSRGRTPRARSELEDAEEHRPDMVAVLGVVIGFGRDEVADAEARLLFFGYVDQFLGPREMVTEARVPGIHVLAVGGHDAHVAGRVEEVTDRSLRVVGVQHTRDVSDHRPRVEHRGWCDDLAVRPVGGCCGVG